jgi:hypothetical protein
MANPRPVNSAVAGALAPLQKPPHLTPNVE